LDGVELIGFADAFDSGDVVTLRFDGEHRAGVNRPGHRPTPCRRRRWRGRRLLGAGQVEPIAQRVEQRDARLDVHLFGLAVNLSEMGISPGPRTFGFLLAASANGLTAITPAAAVSDTYPFRKPRRDNPGLAGASV